MTDATALVRRRLDVRGQVQGVGFRPFVYRLAARHGVGGSVANDNNGATIEIEGSPAALAAFERELLAELPPLARINELARRDLPACGETTFRIRASERDAGRRPEVAPDAATCADCRRELLDPVDRRHRYPFINCTNCGPRYSIIRDVPYDRPQTTMAVFQMCPACQREYDDPADRRFHAQPNACAVCGPRLEWRGCGNAAGAEQGTRSVHGDDALRAAARLLQESGIVAIKGIGGYHLACRADREEVVRRLRERKLRDGKPLALMVPDLATARRLCRLTPADEEALTSPAAPIVLAPKAEGVAIAPSVAPGCGDYGLLLPYAPVHHLLFAEGLGPLVMTSANLAGQPLTYRDEDALRELSDVADAFLRHNREIFRPIDDSVVQTFRGEAVPIRRARGYAPRPIHLGLAPARGPAPRVLAVGGELKATVCLLSGTEAILSEHLGDLTRPEAFRHYVEAIGRLKTLCDFAPDAIACDLHPRYLSTEYARRLDLPLIEVQHHHAHIASVMAEWGEPGPVLGLACDGAGFGPDHAVWGCELLRCERGEVERIGHLEYYPLVGGDAAALETWRPAAALLRAALDQGQGTRDGKTRPRPAGGSPGGSPGRAGPGWPDALRAAGAGSSLPSPSDEALALFERLAGAGAQSPLTSSLGRVFDAVAFLLGLCARNRHEAEAAMAVEAAAGDHAGAAGSYPFDFDERGSVVTLSLRPMFRELIAARQRGESPALVAARFHEALADALAAWVRRADPPGAVATVAVSGGCFANRRLLTRLVERLEADGRRVLYHRHVPCGDGGIALGQAWVAAWRLATERLLDAGAPGTLGS
ncbi:MAG: carbamoyltransferase HypF [Planctomycetota bacterium]